MNLKKKQSTFVMTHLSYRSSYETGSHEVMALMLKTRRSQPVEHVSRVIEGVAWW